MVVFRQSVLFIEPSGEMARYPTSKKIATSGFCQGGVLFAEKGKDALSFMLHPYQPVVELPLTRPFTIAAGEGRQFALVRQEDNQVYLELFRGEIPRAVVVFRETLPAVPVKVLLKQNQVAVVFSDRILFLRLKSVGGGLVVGKSVIYSTPPATKAASLAGTRGLLVLVDCTNLFHLSGWVARLDWLGKQLKECCTGYGRQQLKELHQGYVVDRVEQLFRYRSPCQQLFARTLPCRLHTDILRVYTTIAETELTELFVSAINQLTAGELLRMARDLERAIHLARRASALKSRLFASLGAKLVRVSPRHSHLFYLLAAEAEVPELCTYELLPYRAELIERSKNLGYAVIRADKQRSEERRRQAQQIGRVYVLEDHEHIRDTPKRLDNLLAVAECKELLSGTTVGDFLFDEYDTENRRKKAFVFSMLASVGRGVFLFERNLQANVFEIPFLKVFVKKSNNVVSLNTLNEWEHIWPSFHNAVACALSVPNRPYISTTSINVVTPKNIMELSGSIFGFGLKEAVTAQRQELAERQAMAKSLLLSLSQSYDPLLISSTVLGNAFILRETGDKKLASVLWFNLKSKDSSAVLLMWSALGLGILFMRSNDLFVRQILAEYTERQGAIQGALEGKASYYTKHHRVAGTFALACVSIEAPVKEYLRLTDRTCELILNGLLHQNSRSEKIFRLLSEWSAQATPVNRFYSALMQGLVMGSRAHQEVFQEVPQAVTLEKAYEVAGKVFALGLVSIPEKEKVDENFVSDIVLLLYSLEKQKNIPVVVMDYALLAACLVLNSTGDLRLLGICKELLASLKSVETLEKIVDYSPCSGDYREQYGMRYGRIQHVKMCLSLLAPGCGFLRLTRTPLSVLFLVASFYVEFPLSPEDQDCFQVIRHFYLLAFAPANDPESQKLRESSVIEELHTQLKESAPEDIKIALDIISTYFEANVADTFEPNTLEHIIEDMHETIL